MHGTNRVRWAVVMFFCLWACLSALSAAADNSGRGGPDRCGSPYFFVAGEDSAVDQLPLKSTHAEVKIAGVIAEVTLFQKYVNRGRTTLEAVYIFPASTRAAVHDLKMTIGDRVITAKVEKREQARRDYETARRTGRTASLLEQQRPNVFQMNVANIRPGDEVVVQLSYTEFLTPTDGVYQFVLPTMAGPRYTGGGRGQGTEAWTENPYLESGRPSPFSFGLDLTLTSPLDVKMLKSPSHEIKAEYLSRNQVRVKVPASPEAGTKDFVLDYSLAGKEIQTGVLLFEGREENYFLLMVEPPKRVDTRRTLPREYIFVLDVSGSMRGFPLDTSKELMRDLLSDLESHDLFNIIFFAGGNLALAEKSLPVTKANLTKAMQFVDGQRGQGGTELLPALRKALEMPVRDDGVSRSIVLITDGYVDVEKEAFELVRRHTGRSNMFVFGIGSSVNRYLVEGLARAGQGEAQVVLNRDQAAAKAKAFRQYIGHPLLRGISVRSRGFEAYDLEPAALPDLFLRRPLVMVGKFRGRPQGELVIEGLGPLTESSADPGVYRRTVRLAPADGNAANSALPRLWARKHIQSLADYNLLGPDDERTARITQLGLKYNLLTDYTSFVAVDSQVRGNGEPSVTVKQPLPLPQGVPSSAVGGGYTASRRQGSGYVAALAMPNAAPMPEAYHLDVAAEGAGMSGEVMTGRKKDAKNPLLPVVEPGTKLEAGITLEVLDLKTSCQDPQFELVLERLRHKIIGCFRRAEQTHGKLTGQVVVKIAVGPDRRITAVVVASDKLKGDPTACQELRQCLAGLGEKATKPVAAVACTLATILIKSR